MTKSKIYNSLEHKAPDFWSVLEGTPAFEATERLVQKWKHTQGNSPKRKEDCSCGIFIPVICMRTYFQTSFSQSLGTMQLTFRLTFPSHAPVFEKLLAELYQESGLTLFLNEEYLIGEYILALSFFMPVQFQEKKSRSSLILTCPRC